MTTDVLTKEMLNPKDKELLERALSKKVEDLNEDDKRVIKARQGYLSSVELNAFSSILEEKEEKLTLTKKEIQEKLNEKEVEFPIKATKEELVGLLNEVENN